MRVQVAVVTGVLVACSWGAARADGPVVHLNEIDRYLIKELVVAEVWRPGGAKSEVLADALEGFVKSGNFEAASCLVGEALPFVHRRLLDVAPFAAALQGGIRESDRMSHADWGSVTKHLDGCVELEKLSQDSRFAIYHQLIGAKARDRQYGLSYVDACLRGLWEDPQRFLREAEAVCFNPAGVWANPYTPDLGRSVVRVARARAENRTMDAVLDLVEAAVKAELRPGELVDGVAPDELLNEALLALLMDKQTRAVRRLKEIWRSIPVAARPQGLHAQTRAAFAAQGRMDSEPPRDTRAGRYLVRAIRGLGDPTFQEKNLRFERSLGLGPDTVLEELQRKGLYKAEHE